MRNSLHFCTPANIPKTVDRILDHLVPGGLLIVNEPGDHDTTEGLLAQSSC